MKFLREVFSDGGQGSFSRVAQGAVVLGVIFWVSYLVIKNHALPDLGGPSLFLGTGAVGHYGVGKAQEMLSLLKGNGNGQQPTDGH